MISVMRRRSISAMIALTIMLLGVLYVLRWHPMMGVSINWPVKTEIIVFNPFRSRGPEHAVQKWLQPGFTAQWSHLQISPIVNQPRAEESSQWICGYPPAALKKWSLEKLAYEGNGDDRDKLATLQYELKCSNSTKQYLFVQVEKKHEGWTVTLFSSSGQPHNLSPETAAEHLILKVAPVYPEQAKAAGIHGKVVLHVIIAPDGSVYSAMPREGNPLLSSIAINAVKQWKYRPFMGHDAIVTEDHQVFKGTEVELSFP